MSETIARTRITSTCAVGSSDPDQREAHDWRVAGEAWGHRSVDWACLWEHYSREVVAAIFDAIELSPGRDLLDIACGSGLAMTWARARGARTAGIDAAEALIRIAAQRNPTSDLRVGTMFALPWPDESFDHAISINGIWGGCEEALAEAFRVLKPGGKIGLSFWGAGPPLDLRDCFRVFAANAPTDHRQGMRRTNQISRPGHAEAMLEESGLRISRRESRVSVVEWPDLDTALRAMTGVGPAVPALENIGIDRLRGQLRPVLEQLRDDTGIYRMRNELCYVVATKPSPGHP